jgi:K+ transporter
VEVQSLAGGADGGAARGHRCHVLSANLLKLVEGGWVPLLFGGTMVLLMLTWRRGTSLLANKTRRIEVPLDTLIRSLEKNPPTSCRARRCS